MLKINIERKDFGNKIILQNIDLTISKNGIYGVVGKNGEGKTTFFKCINSLTPFKGNVEYNNKVICKKEIAFFPTEVPIYDELTSKEFSRFYKELLDLKDSAMATNIFDVPQEKLIKTFSTGMKKKAYMNAVFQTEYPIYIFDEPFNGLDLESNYLLMQYLRRLAKTSIIFISTHILDSLYKDCETIFLIQDSKITAFEKQEYETIENILFSK